MYLNGEASLEHQGNRLTGESIRYDIVKGEVDASTADKPGRVRMRLNPATKLDSPEGDPKPE